MGAVDEKRGLHRSRGLWLFSFLLSGDDVLLGALYLDAIREV